MCLGLSCLPAARLQTIYQQGSTYSRCILVYSERDKSNRKLLRRISIGENIENETGKTDVKIVFHQTPKTFRTFDFVAYHEQWSSALEQELTIFLLKNLNLTKEKAKKIAIWISKNYTQSSQLFTDPVDFRVRILQLKELQKIYPEFKLGTALNRWPKLLHYSAEYVAQGLWNFKHNFSFVPLLKVIKRAPSLLTRDPGTLRRNWELIKELLGDENAVKAVNLFPGLLNYSQENLFQSMNYLEQLFDGKDVRSLVAAKPQILATAHLGNQLSELGILFNFSSDKVQDLVIKQPGILSMSTEHVGIKFQRIKELCKLVEEWNNQCEKWSLSELGRSLTCSLERIERLEFIYYNLNAESYNQRSCLAWLIMPEMEFFKYYK
eukprot:TRINITY_DN5117_c1_g1_i1.p1 TRINITY_DN5117_c1_g1~~TRINITY_DN5117_c1_g1_i1.p1  ORF type:complete len:399 (+),score=14.17 TRINITY_DN5117_c1_g1_i1:63-1199(+)